MSKLVFTPALLTLRLGIYPAKFAHEITHIAAVRPFVEEYDVSLHPLGPTRFSTPERYAWPLMALGALAPTVIGGLFAVVIAVTRPELFTAAFTAIPYWILYAIGITKYMPPDHLLAWVGVDIFWFVYTWPSADDLDALSPK